MGSSAGLFFKMLGNILEYRVQLTRVCLQILQVILPPVNLQNEHPSQDSSLDCGMFVVGEINSLAPSQETEDLFQVALRQQLFRFFRLQVRNVGMLTNLGEFLGYLLGGEY